jgi:hypothetical protein
MNEAKDHKWSETRLRVRYAETDQAGVVYHSNYLIGSNFAAITGSITATWKQGPTRFCRSPRPT